MLGGDKERDIAGPWIFGPSDHVVEPGTRAELFRGRIIWVPPARPGRADIHSRLNKVISHHEVDGYVTSSNLLTRRSYDNDESQRVRIHVCEDLDILKR